MPLHVTSDETSAIAIIQELTAPPEQDKVYMGRVERITDFGAFIEVMPGVDGRLGRFFSSTQRTGR